MRLKNDSEVENVEAEAVFVSSLEIAMLLFYLLFSYKRTLGKQVKMIFIW